MRLFMIKQARGDDRPRHDGRRTNLRASGDRAVVRGGPHNLAPDQRGVSEKDKHTALSASAAMVALRRTRALTQLARACAHRRLSHTTLIPNIAVRQLLDQY